jgi:hypothetical protein
MYAIFFAINIFIVCTFFLINNFKLSTVSYVCIHFYDKVAMTYLFRCHEFQIAVVNMVAQAQK